MGNNAHCSGSEQEDIPASVKGATSVVNKKGPVFVNRRKFLWSRTCPAEVAAKNCDLKKKSFTIPLGAINEVEMGHLRCILHKLCRFLNEEKLSQIVYISCRCYCTVEFLEHGLSLIEGT